MKERSVVRRIRSAAMPSTPREYCAPRDGIQSCVSRKKKSPDLRKPAKVQRGTDSRNSAPAKSVVTHHGGFLARHEEHDERADDRQENQERQESVHSPSFTSGGDRDTRNRKCRRPSSARSSGLGRSGRCLLYTSPSPRDRTR